MKQYDQMLQQQLQKKDGIGSAFVFEGEKQGTYFLFDETEICAGQKDAWTTNCFDLVKEQKMVRWYMLRTMLFLWNNLVVFHVG